MSDDDDKRILKEMDRVLEAVKADAERRGIDTRGKSMEEIKELLESRESLKGEFTLVIEGNSQDKGEFDSETIDDLLLYFKKEGVSLKDAVKQVAVDSGVSKSKIYRKALQIWE